MPVRAGPGPGIDIDLRYGYCFVAGVMGRACVHVTVCSGSDAHGILGRIGCFFRPGVCLCVVTFCDSDALWASSGPLGEGGGGVG